MKGSLYLALGLLGSVSAVPANLKPRAIPQSQLDDFIFYSQYAAAAYCPDNNDTPDTKVTCDAGNCPLIEVDDTKTITEFENTFESDTTGFVAVDKTKKIIIVSFRGTTSVRNWITNFDFAQDDVDWCEDCKVHGGWWNAWREISKTVRPAIKKAKAANPDFKVVMTGHSLGGAIAAIAAADLRTNGTEIALYTFGQPRIGNAATSSFISNQPGGNFRVTHTVDPVPRLPPVLFGYKHISPEYYIKQGENTVSPSDIETLTGGVNLLGNSGTVGLDIDAHLTYFGGIADCSPGSFPIED
ncbi:MAG: hypothetical protein M1825_001866 [Sarcosagium campestre]|nr:MAG: hypothetical protein M1825_001866 [Sarcosagium campestre]